MALPIYAYGVLIDPIRAATRWLQAGLGAVFSAVLVIAGARDVAGGRMVDRVETRAAFALAGSAGTGAIFVASAATACSHSARCMRSAAG